MSFVLCRVAPAVRPRCMAAYSLAVGLLLAAPALTSAQGTPSVPAPTHPGLTLSYPAGKGLRMLATGHSWVMPALATLPQIARAGAFPDHQLLAHTNGGEKGSVRAVWAAEMGLALEGRNPTPRKTILLPAIATGQWDVMTWGVYSWDTAEDYYPWIEACRQANPAMRFYIQDGWSETWRYLTPGGEIDLGKMQERQAFINTMLAALVKTLRTQYPDSQFHVIPVGSGIGELVKLLHAKKLPFIQVLDSKGGKRPGIYRDGGHLDERNSGLGWFEGYIYYATLYRKPPADITVASKVPDAALDTLFRQLAWDVVTRHPLSGVTAMQK